MIAALLLFLLDAAQGHVCCAAVIVEFAGEISKLILATMHKLTYKRFYSVVAVLGLVLLYVYITLALLFIVVATMIAYEYLQFISVVMVFAGALWVWIPAINIFGTRLLLGLSLLLH